MTLDLEMAAPAPVPTQQNPFALGWRLIDNGTGSWRRPLTETDLLYPKEGDFVVNNAAHHDDRCHLMEVFRDRIRGKSGVRVFGDHLIDFGVEGLPNLGPDVIVLNGEPREWNPYIAVFPVKDMGARPLFVVELTSPTTRKKDLTDKLDLYYRAGVPVYVIVDLVYGGGKSPAGIVAYQAGPTAYELLAPEQNGWVWLEVVEVYLAAENGCVVCYDRDQQRIGSYQDAIRARTTMREEYQKAIAERQAAEAKLKELEAELKRLRGDNQ